MSASLIGRSGSSTFRLSAAAVSMSLTGSRFSSESAPRPFHYGIEDEVEQSLQRPCRQTKRQVQADMRTHLIHRPVRDIIHHSVELEFPSIGFDPVEFSCCCRGLSPGPTELGAVHPDAVHDHGQPTRQRHDRLFHPATPGNLHRPGLKPRPFLRIQRALSRFVEHDPHHLVAAT